MDVFSLLLIAVGVFFVIGALLATISTGAWVLIIPIALLFFVNSYPAVTFALLLFCISSFKYLDLKGKCELTLRVFIVEVLAVSAGYSAIAIGAAVLLGDLFSGFGTSGEVETCTRAYCP